MKSITLKSGIFRTVAIKFILMLCLGIFTGKAFGQSVYEIKFTGQSDTTRYTCLLVYYNENDAYARIAFYNKNQYRVVETRYTGKSGKWSDGRSYFSLTGYNPRYITSKSETESYNPDYFVWINGAPTPYTTDDQDQTKDRDVFKVDSYVKLNLQTVTKGYLRSFYGDQEKDYLAFLQLTDDYKKRYVIDNNFGTTLHLITLANTSIYDIGAGCQVDVDHLNNEFSEIARTLKISFNPVTISGANFSKENLLYQLDNLRVGPSDIVIFVYRGHGFRWSNQTSPYPSLALTRSHATPVTTENTILLETVYTKIKNKGGRLNIVMADCCNTDIGRNQWTNNNYLYIQSNASAKFEKLNDLFLNRQGNLLFSASAKGEVSWTNAVSGGFFTSSFLQALSEETSYLRASESSWDNIITNTRNYALSKSATTADLTPQHAIYYNQITKR